jgi:uncharacterized cupredoxin-like copper-binding protein
MHRRLATLSMLVLAVALAACGGSSAGTPAGTPAATPAATGEAPAAAGPVRVEVTLTDKLKMEPSAITVPAGVPVTFVVTNTGTVLHEFVVGDEEVQAEHEEEMKEAGGMTMAEDEPDAIGVEPGQTKELTMTFDEPGTTIAGCHVVGHYGAGMKATVTIQ